MPGTERVSQFEKALLELRSAILTGQFEANSRLAETALAERLGISRTPLRQAMDRLVEEGLLERAETGRCRVASFTMDDIIDAIEMRGVIEGTAARLAAERGADPELVKECREVLAGLDRATAKPDAIDFRSYVRLNGRFHELISMFSGSRVVQREVERASRLPLASPSAFLQGQEVIEAFLSSLPRAQRQHHQIFEAILAREGARAEALAREHARLARENLKYALQAGPDLAEHVPGLALVSNS
ncbi:GntR family transcriptional regulator [Pseudoruegeria sp. HB172150]|uniref:GntR family transcriptional regulator n=1 Tax=Pseudoruegeria sp. HB172150 TaxID=2721164 RepID=UPI001553C707|nr:GntR family transcriptional regulator [Pseudoruegeria sp. HB172150]